MPLPNSGFYGNSTFRQSRWRGERAKCSAWAKCLGYRATAIKPDNAYLMQKKGRESITLHFNSNSLNSNSLRGRQAAFGGDRVSWRGWQSRSRGNHKIEFSIARGAHSSSNRATVLCHARALWRWLAEGME